MSFSYRLHELAQKDYEVSLAWYVAASIKAAENFILEVEHTLQLITDNPGRWRNEYKHYRELGLKKYPFIINYTLVETNSQ